VSAGVFALGNPSSIKDKKKSAVGAANKKGVSKSVKHKSRSGVAGRKSRRKAAESSDEGDEDDEIVDEENVPPSNRVRSSRRAVLSTRQVYAESEGDFEDE